MVCSYDVKNKPEQNSRKQTYLLNITENITKKGRDNVMTLEKVF
jgi:hypothetical protein